MIGQMNVSPVCRVAPGRHSHSRWHARERERERERRLVRGREDWSESED